MSPKVAIPIVDQWEEESPEDVLFKNAKDIILAPVSSIYKLDNTQGHFNIDMFWIKPKKSYNSDQLRPHTCRYLNYFEKYFDEEKEYITNLSYIKFMVDYYPDYNKNNLIYDLNRYILQESIFNKVTAMVDFNYSLVLTYKSQSNPQLQYTDAHAKALMGMSILMNMCIPIITHFAYMRKIGDIDEFLLDIYDFIMYAPQYRNMDIMSKLYETSISNVSRNAKNNAIVWMKQDIRGRDTITHSMGAVKNIVLNIMPKYTFEQNMISLNYTSIQKSNKYQVTDIQYEYNYIPLSSSRREGEDNASDFDRFEANLIKTDESLYCQNVTNYKYSMKMIEKQWGPFDEREISYYMRELKDDNNEIINNFQKQLIFNLFYKYFGDTVSINAINKHDYIELMLAAKKMLQNGAMGILPWIVSSKVSKVISRKTLNKKELAEMQASQYYPLVEEKFKNPKIIQQILGTIATIITSTFTMIDFHNQENTGKPIPMETKFIIEETLLYVLLI